MRTLLLLLAACSNASNGTPDAPPHPIADAPVTVVDTPMATVDAGPLRILVLNEVAAGEDPDWFEIVNATTQPIELSDFAYVDALGMLDKAVAFPRMTLAAGAFYAQDVSGAFKLGSDEELWIYRKSDGMLSDGVDWNEGDSPEGSSYARDPDVFGAWKTTSKQTEGAPNKF